ncbi:MAG: class I SAM-dependent methyltransferase family protein, partial [Nanoarchaeota archaeon]
GKFRIQKYSFILGERRFETIHVENGVKISLDIRKSYFSPRSSGERLRIAKLVKPAERILILFSGVAPYPVVISRNSKASEIIGVEMNKEAHHYAKRNLTLNKIKNTKLILGDAGKEIPKLKGKFDRIVMPLPKHADIFLIKAFSKVKNRGWIHFYDFSRDFESTRIKVREAAQKAGVKVLIRRIVKCGQQSPGVFRVCADIQVTFS